MNAAIMRQLDTWARQSVPATSTMVLVLPFVVPVGLPAAASVTPVITFMAVFYWTVYRPDLLPAPVVFLTGLIHDILLGGPIGLFLLAFLATYWVTLTQRNAFIGKPFVLAWLGFAVIAAGAFLLMWIVTCLLAARLVLTPDPLFQYGVTAASFPLATWLFVRLHRYMER